MYFQDLILALQAFWVERGCLLVQPYNSEVGAGTYNPATFLRALGPEPWKVAFVEPSPSGRCGATALSSTRTGCNSFIRFPGHPRAVAVSTSR